VIAATEAALHQLRTKPELRRQLTANARQLYDGLQRLGFELGPEPSPVVSAVMPSPEAAFGLWAALLKAGLYTNVSLPPATPKGLALLRSSVSAAHSRAQIDQAIALFGELGGRLGLLENARSFAPAK
jgi:8-amino-7-oxononanoate synthase